MKRLARVFSFAWIGGCASSAAPPAQHTPATHAETGPDAGASGDAETAHVDTTLPNIATMVTERDADALAAHGTPLRQAIAQAATHPEEALAALVGNPFSLAWAWRAYILRVVNREAESEQILTALGVGPVGADAGYADPAMARALLAIRGSAEVLTDPDAEGEGWVPCWLLDRHEHDGYRAFGVQHLSNYDGLMAPTHYRCATERLRRRAPRETDAALGAALRLREGVFRVLPVPEEGTMYRGLAMAVGQSLDEALALGVTTPPSDGTPRAVAAAASRAASVDRRVASRLRAWNALRDRESLAFGRGLCASMQAPPTTRCSALAAAVADHALVVWLDAVTNAGR